MTFTEYTVKEFGHLFALKGITESEMTEHLKLYKGYVTNLNALHAKITEIVQAGNAGSLEFCELNRRIGFEFNGMRLHELYFENLSGTGSEPSTLVVQSIESAFIDVKNWEMEFRKIAAMRGVGWTMLYKDPANGSLSNHWIGMHEEGHPAGCKPILVMDCWEHAWAGYLKPTERGKYIDDFFANIDWGVVEKRLTE